MEEKPFSDDILQNEMYAKFVKDVSLEKIEDECSGLSIEDVVVLRSQAGN
jgi:hypothetical protein